MPLGPSFSAGDVHVALVLGGGNALGSYHAGVYAALHDCGVEPDWIVGTSAGAINGAIIAGNPRKRRVERLRELWRPGGADWPTTSGETTRRTGAVLATLVGGRRGMFAPVGPLGSWWLPDAGAGAPGLYDTGQLTATLRDLIDFDRLNDGAMRFAALAVDVEDGSERLFDTANEVVHAEHIRASAALLPIFPPIEVDGRLYIDGGASMNLPLDPVLSTPPDAPTLCIAVELLPLTAPRPRTLGEATERIQDLIYAVQSRRSVERWRDRYAYAPPGGGDRPAAVTLAYVAYREQHREVAGKAMDFSPESAADRWRSGYADAAAMLESVEDGTIPLGRPGLAVHGL